MCSTLRILWTKLVLVIHSKIKYYFCKKVILRFIMVVIQDPECWCEAAFRNTEFIIVATSPPSKKPALSTIYENTSNYLLRLVRERKFQIEKRCYIVQLPYCKSDDIPEETKHLKRLSLPKELPKLVKIIHATERVKCASSASDRKFLDSVKLAKLETLEEDVNSVKDGQETGQLNFQLFA